VVAAPPWTATPDGLVLTVRLTPRGGRDAIDGIERLADGRSDVCIVAGAAARVKRIDIRGAGRTLAAVLEQLCAVS